jgi:putative ABC transport system permease protein
MSFAVAQRTHEIGLRMALGANSANVVKLILREGMILAVAGVLLGLVGSYFVGQGMSSLVYGIGKIDFTAFSIVATLLMMSAVLACYVPAHRATRVDPMQALREE